ncbi:MAG TPA: hypothetical protein VFF33_01355 [Ignavibacteriaceae bacterium]|nr:hypothetical protein [Ignavibacteriaceae bacterium]
MGFKIRLGQPEFEKFWNNLVNNYRDNTISKKDLKIFKQIVKTMKLLCCSPKHNSLHSHEIFELTKENGIKIWQSYIVNNTPAAGRIFWAYGPGKGEITILGYSPHPDDKKGAYKSLNLSGFPKLPNEE